MYTADLVFALWIILPLLPARGSHTSYKKNKLTLDHIVTIVVMKLVTIIDYNLQILVLDFLFFTSKCVLGVDRTRMGCYRVGEIRIRSNSFLGCLYQYTICIDFD